ncbi:uncharacterized protein BXZ73DRAFT_103972 [Epithele typhae]|uniref:uncharacterized protein n=1 Tax=Epithele typhae TaxID=378194 RepID=UPI0020079F98|nr:uncharacterized protein BXZ73DRAFT_103972 [Epithele typhae]KAH9923177.1 hypothetical protein BXZ73DRAFT_103972 [Epithele typhae]
MRPAITIPASAAGTKSPSSPASSAKPSIKPEPSSPIMVSAIAPPVPRTSRPAVKSEPLESKPLSLAAVQASTAPVSAPLNTPQQAPPSTNSPSRGLLTIKVPVVPAPVSLPSPTPAPALPGVSEAVKQTSNASSAPGSSASSTPPRTSAALAARTSASVPPTPSSPPAVHASSRPPDAHGPSRSSASPPNVVSQERTGAEASANADAVLRFCKEIGLTVAVAEKLRALGITDDDRIAALGHVCAQSREMLARRLEDVGLDWTARLLVMDGIVRRRAGKQA